MHADGDKTAADAGDVAGDDGLFQRVGKLCRGSFAARQGIAEDGAAGGGLFAVFDFRDRILRFDALGAEVFERYALFVGEA